MLTRKTRTNHKNTWGDTSARDAVKCSTSSNKASASVNEIGMSTSQYRLNHCIASSSRQNAAAYQIIAEVRSENDQTPIFEKYIAAANWGLDQDQNFGLSRSRYNTGT